MLAGLGLIVSVISLMVIAHNRGLSAPRADDLAVFQPPPLLSAEGDEPYLRVHVAGAVNKPGVYVFRATDRVIDAIDQAGGQRPDARMDDLNLAAFLQDGIRLYVPGQDDKPTDEILVVTEQITIKPPPPPLAPTPIGTDDWLDELGGGSAVETTLGAVGKAGGGAGESDRKPLPAQAININTAGLEELQQLPGVGPALARRILAYRATQGRFSEPRDLTKVSGIGDKTFDKMAGYVVVD